MSNVTYQDGYILNVQIRSISGRTRITEQDIGLAKGTLPPQEVASLGSLITVDREALNPFHTLRTRTQRFCEGKGVKVGLGFFIPKSELQSAYDELEQLKEEYYAAKAVFLSDFKATLDQRMQDFPEYAKLLAASSPTYDYVDKHIQYDIDVVQVGYAKGDPHENLLSATLNRPENNISCKLLDEVASFCQSIYERSISDKQFVVKRNLTPLRSTLLPKLESFQILDGRLTALSKHLRDLIEWSDKTLDAIPKGDARAIVGNDYHQFCRSFDTLRSADAMKSLIAAQSSRNGLSVVPNRPKPEPAVANQPPATPNPSSGASVARAPAKRINF